MRISALIIVLLCAVSSCKSSKSTRIQTKKEYPAKKISRPETGNLADAVIRNARAYEGVRYKYGGTTKSGMDCSGLIYTAFKEENIDLPRVSRYMAGEGIPLELNDVREGDLIFFVTSKNKKNINHAGLVVANTGGDIRFIHSSTSKGVITSSLNETYWRKAYVTARRIL